MLVPLTRKKFEQLIPLLAIGSQYKYYWGKFTSFLQRLLTSVVLVAALLLLKILFGLELGPILIIPGVFGGFFWLWYPVFQASIRNSKIRKYKYSGFLRGEVLDWWIAERLMGKQETVNNKGELVIIENREKRIHLEIGDETGFTVEFDAPLRANHKVITRGLVAEMLLMSDSPDLNEIEDFSDVYIPQHDLWISDYPCLRQDFFLEVSLRLGGNRQRPRRKRVGG
jgi:hypothetical protein